MSPTTPKPTATPSYYPTVTSYLVSMQTFSYTGASQTFAIPAHTSYVDVSICGAPGGNYNGQANGGFASGSFYLDNQQNMHTTAMYIFVGQQGGQEGQATFNGGGAGSPTSGGGASDIRVNGTSLSHRILVAGGGGGYYSYSGTAGPGGGLQGGNAANSNGGGATGGSQTAGGIAAGNPLGGGTFGFGGTR